MNKILPTAIAATLTILLIGGGIFAYMEIYPTYKVKELVKAVLKDPNSAEFSSINARPKAGVACGLVNAKNSLGGYTGAREFIILENGKVAFQPEAQMPQCTEPRIPSNSDNRNLSDVFEYPQLVARYKVQQAEYMSCKKIQEGILAEQKAFLDRFSTLCPDAKR